MELMTAAGELWCRSAGEASPRWSLRARPTPRGPRLRLRVEARDVGERKETSDGRERERRAPDRARAVHVYSAGFSGAANERLQRACVRAGASHRRFADFWDLLQELFSCWGGSLVRRPDLVLINAEDVGDADLDWLRDLVGELPVWQVRGDDLSSQSAEELARRIAWQAAAPASAAE